jgi:hypothetical protein
MRAIGGDMYGTYLLPAVFAPDLAILTTAQMRNIAHDAIHCPAKQLGVLVVHGDRDKHFRAPAHHVLA